MGAAITYVALQLAVAAYGTSTKYFHEGVAGAIGGLALVVYAMLIHATVAFPGIRSVLLAVTLVGVISCGIVAQWMLPADEAFLLVLTALGANSLFLVLVQYLERIGVVGKRTLTNRPSTPFEV
jgi:hypothetical protein